MVVRITAGVLADPSKASYGTGFCYAFQFENGQNVPMVISNKHVLSNRPWLSFALADTGPDGRRKLGPAIDVRISQGTLPVIDHPDPDVDLAMIPLNPLVQIAAQQGRTASTVCLQSNNALPAAEIVDLHAASQVLMVGFPNGLMDATNNLPVVRRGVLATPLSADYQGRPDFAVDIAAFGGSSGSPVFAFFDGLREQGGSMVMGGRSFHFIGVLHSGPVMDAQGILVQRPVPTEAVPITQLMLNIGICAKARLIDDFRPAVAQLLGLETLPIAMP